MRSPHAMPLPPPRGALGEDPFTDGMTLTQQVGTFYAWMSFYKQEFEDSDITPMGQITPAECVKLSYRLAKNQLERYCWSLVDIPHRPGYQQRQVWPWLTAVQAELREIFLAMGEPSKAGSNWSGGGGPMPPISWPGGD